MTIPQVQSGPNANQTVQALRQTGSYSANERVIVNTCLNLIGMTGVITIAVADNLNVSLKEKAGIIVLGSSFCILFVFGRIVNYYLYNQYGKPDRPQNCLV